MELICSADLIFPMSGLMQLDFLGGVLDGKDEPDLISSEWLLDRIPVDSDLFIFIFSLCVYDSHRSHRLTKNGILTILL